MELASAYQAHLVRTEFHLVLLEKTKIMGSSFAKRGADNQSTQIIDHDLSFEGVALLLTTVEQLLFFLAVQLLVQSHSSVTRNAGQRVQ